MAEPIAGLRIEIPDEPVELREAVRERLLALVGPESERDHDVRLGLWLWEQWRPSLEPAGLGREAFLDIVVGYRREVWFWVLGDRRWAQCVDGLVGRVARRIPKPGHDGADTATTES